MYWIGQSLVSAFQVSNVGDIRTPAGNINYSMPRQSEAENSIAKFLLRTYIYSCKKRQLTNAKCKALEYLR